MSAVKSIIFIVMNKWRWIFQVRSFLHNGGEFFSKLWGLFETLFFFFFIEIFNLEKVLLLRQVIELSLQSG